MSRLREIAYACGSPGFQLSDRIVVSMLIYFYLPPGDSDLVPQISTELFWGTLTAFGIAMLAGRIFDSIADPAVGYLSDRSRSRLGRRRLFMILGILPMCLLPLWAFWPPAEPGSDANWIFLCVILALYFIAFTSYVGPYLALLPEVARSESERVRLATLSGAIGMPIAGFFGVAWTAAIGWGVAGGLSTTESIRLIALVASLAGLALSAVPILFVDERRYSHSQPADLPFGQALRETLGNIPFLLYLLAQIFFIFGLNLLQPAIPYVAQVLLGRPVGFAAQLGGGLFVGIILGFALIHRLSAGLGAKYAMLTCVLFFGLGVGLLSFISPDVPGGPNDMRNLVITFSGLILAGIPISGFVVLPPVLLGQIIDADEARMGANRAAIFFGMQGLMTKWVYGLATATLAYLLTRFGNSQAEPLGVWLVAPVAGVACIVSAALYALYPQERVLAARQSSR